MVLINRSLGKQVKKLTQSFKLLIKGLLRCKLDKQLNKQPVLKPNKCKSNATPLKFAEKRPPASCAN